MFTGGNGSYPPPANPTGTHIKWGGYGGKKIPGGLLTGENLNPSGLAEVGLGVPDPYPLTRIPATPPVNEFLEGFVA